MSLFFPLSTAFIPRRSAKRVQDVWVVEAPVEVSLSCVCVVKLSVSGLMFQHRLVIFYEAIYRSKLARASHRPGSSCPASCCWKWCPALCNCHFLSLPGVSKETQACFLTKPVLAAPNWLMFLMKYCFSINVISLSCSFFFLFFCHSFLNLSCFFVGCEYLTVVWWWFNCNLTVRRKWYPQHWTM